MLDRQATFQSMAQELETLAQAGQLRQLRTTAPLPGQQVCFQGQECYNLSSNDYLGLASDQAFLRDFYQELLQQELLPSGSMGSASSRLLTGNGPAYGQLEEALRQAYGRQGALVFNSGYHANIGLLPALVGKGDVVFCDKLNHASIIDGIRLSGAELLRYRHLDYGHLEQLLAQRRPGFGRALIVTESVFSMDGDVADLRALHALAHAHGCLLYVDEAHGVGAWGDRGLGVCEQQGMLGEVDVLVGAFGKALASHGGFAVCDGLLQDYLLNRCRSLIFSTALPQAVVQWNLRVLQTVEGMGAERTHLHALSARLRQGLQQRGIRTMGESNIVPVVVGDNRAALALAEHLREQGFLAFAIRPPSVPPGTARLRLSLTAAMRWEELSVLPDLIASFLHAHTLA